MVVLVSGQAYGQGMMNELEPTRIGPHLLGRKHVPDDRDWQLQDMLDRADAFTRSETIGELVDDPSFNFWSTYVLWRYIKAQRATPSPTPSPTPVPPSPTPPPPSPSPATSKVWEDLVQLDQGNFGTCVGNGWAGWGDSAPIEDRFTETDARAIYYEATVIDGQPDNPDVKGGGQQGSNVRSGAKAMQNRHKLAAYAFGTPAQAADWLLADGTVVFGSDWTNDMFKPDGNGFVLPTGGVAGGHCYLAIGYDRASDVFEFQNSWGTGWGKGGRFFMHGIDVLHLNAQQGECCFALEL